MAKVEKKIDTMGFFDRIKKGRRFRDVTDLGIKDADVKAVQKLIKENVKSGTSFAKGFGNFKKKK